MTLPTVTDPITLLDQALENEDGITIKVTSRAAAEHHRHRLHKARARDRLRSKDQFSPGEDGYGTSPYDVLATRIEETKDGVILRVAPQDKLDLGIIAVSPGGSKAK